LISKKIFSKQHFYFRENNKKYVFDKQKDFLLTIFEINLLNSLLLRNRTELAACRERKQPSQQAKTILLDLLQYTL